MIILHVCNKRQNCNIMGNHQILSKLCKKELSGRTVPIKCLTALQSFANKIHLLIIPQDCEAIQSDGDVPTHFHLYMKS